MDGQPKLPISQNKYLYASGDGVNGSDPAGLMTMGEVGASLDIQGILGNIARDQISGYIQDKIFGCPEDSNASPCLYEVMIAQLIKAIAGSLPDGGTSLAAMPAATLIPSNGPKHHTIPEYMCGASSQELVVLSRAQHDKLHKELYGFNIAVKVAGKAYDLLFRKKNRFKDIGLSPIAQTARTPYGREAIAVGLGIFYQNYGYGGSMWADLGRGTKSGQPLFLVFLKESWRFAGAHHSYPACKKR
jgi:hypothetical protein